MVRTKCIRKIKDKSTKTIGYRLQYDNGQTSDITVEQLKLAIQNNEINVTNMKITKAGSLITCNRDIETASGLSNLKSETNKQNTKNTKQNTKNNKQNNEVKKENSRPKQKVYKKTRYTVSIDTANIAKLTVYDSTNNLTYYLRDIRIMFNEIINKQKLLCAKHRN